MKILLIDLAANFLDFAMRCEADGHEVRWFNAKDKHGERHPAGDGLVTKVAEWKPSMRWADLIVLSDNIRFMPELQKYRDEGYPIFGPHVIGAEWELDRDCGQKVMEEAGIECLPTILFQRFDEALAHVEANPDKRYVCKPLGDCDKALSYVSKDARDLHFMLTQWKKTMPNAPFILQEFVAGIEVAVGGWVGRNGFAAHFLENFEFKKLMAGEKGPNTGEMGTVVKYVTLEESKLAQELLMPLEAELIRNGYTGYIDVAVIVAVEGEHKGKPCPLEFTTRPGWPLFQIQQVLHKESASWMANLCAGADTFEPYNDIAVGVVVAMPDFPFNKIKRELLCGFPVWGITKENRYWIHPCEMMLGEGPEFVGGKIKPQPMLVSCGQYLMVVTGVGKTISKAREAAYDHIKELEIPNSPGYRVDIGCRLEEQLPKLQKLGYCTSWNWE